MTKVGDAMLLGVMAFVPRNASVPSGHRLVDVGYGQVESGAWYLVRRGSGNYDVRRVAADFAQPAVATRTILRSPFPGDAAIYFGGYDANKAPAHDTAWIARADAAAALGVAH